MKVLITGASGLIGTALTDHLRQQGHTVAGLERARRADGSPWWDIKTGIVELADFADTDAVVHLAGENIAQGRWDRAKKKRILRSRVDGTRLLTRTLADLPQPPRVLISASAVGYYGSRGDEWLDESCHAGEGFLAEVCQQWEEAAKPAAEAGIRTVFSRTGVVLSARGGALKEMLVPFRLGLGGAVGPGSQYLSWISLPDAVAALHFLLTCEELSGPVNLTSPNPVTNRDFSRTLGRILHRPAFLPIPATVVRLLFGEKADQLMLASTRAAPRRLQEAGFAFQYPELDRALTAVLSKS